MDQELQKQLVAVLAKLMDVAQQGATWTAGQIPPLIQEKIIYGRIEHTLGVVVCAFFIYCTYHAAGRSYRLAKESDDLGGEEIAGILGVIGSVVGFLIAVAYGLSHLNWALMAWFAPRLFIVEWLSSLIKGGQ